MFLFPFLSFFHSFSSSSLRSRKKRRKNRACLFLLLLSAVVETFSPARLRFLSLFLAFFFSFFFGECVSSSFYSFFLAFSLLLWMNIFFCWISSLLFLQCLRHSNFPGEIWAGLWSAKPYALRRIEATPHPRKKKDTKNQEDKEWERKGKKEIVRKKEKTLFLCIFFIVL